MSEATNAQESETTRVAMNSKRKDRARSLLVGARERPPSLIG